MALTILGWVAANLFIALVWVNLLLLATQTSSECFDAQRTSCGRRMNHPQRQFLNYLRHADWVKVSALPEAPRVIVKLMGLGWIERTGSGAAVSFRITEAGLDALKKPVPVR